MFANPFSFILVSVSLLLLFTAIGMLVIDYFRDINKNK